LNTGSLEYHRGSSATPYSKYDYETCIDRYFNPVTLGLTAGFGSTLIVQPRYNVTAELRFNYDLTSATEKKKFVDFNTTEEWYFDSTRFFDIAVNLCFVYRTATKN